ncbi:MAG TPA: OmpH family outer membrane protein [Gammaproteobacteria bacterium]|nr:OmpH family outer membrane protein [Gammaproteobacteria bacterium]
MKLVNKISLLLIVLSAVMYTGNILAAEIKIGVVDRAILLQKSPQAEAATKLMHQKFDSRSIELTAQQNKIKDLQDQINRNGAIMSASQLQTLENQLDSLQQDFRRKTDDFQADLNTQRNQELGDLQAAIDKAAQKFAKAQNYNLIIDKGVAYYADSTVDVTDQVLSQMQKDFKNKTNPPSNGGK